MTISRFLSTLAAGLALAALAGAGRAQPVAESLQTRGGVEIKVETIAEGLNHPWGMAFLPDGRLLVTERNTGNLYLLSKGGALSKPLAGLPKVYAQGQGGLMDVAIDPNFETNHYVYLSFASPGSGGTATTALGRGVFAGGRIENFRIIFEQQPYVRGSNHFGNRIEFSPDGEYLYFALGERFQFDPAQDLSTHLGKVIRLYPDGRVPADNPFVGRRNAEDEIWSYGHRNIEAMAFQPATGVLWVGEMGPLGGDELNRIEKGANYGWPVVSWGDNYDGSEIPDPPRHPRFADATRRWTPVISPSGMEFYRGDMFPEWKGDALIGGLSAKELVRLQFDGTKVKAEERLPLPARIRDVEEAPDGSIYVLTDESEGKIWRLSRMR